MSNPKQFFEFTIDAEKLSEVLYSHLAPRLESLKQEINDLVKRGVNERNSETAVQGNEFLSRKETMDFLTISGNCLREWTNSGYLNAYRLGKRTYYRRSEIIEKLLSSNSRARDSE